MIVVIGGGISGLAVGWELRQRGLDFVVLESDSEPGGVIRSAEVEGRVADWGPQRIRLTSDVRRLIDAVGLGDEVLVAPEGLDLWMYRGGRMRRVPFSLFDFALGDVLSIAGRMRVALEPFTRGVQPGERVSEYLTRKFGREAYEGVLGPLYGGLYSTDPAEMAVDLSLIHSLQQARIGRSLLMPLIRRGGKIQPPPAASFRPGMQALPDAIARSLGDDFRAGSAVRGLEPSGSGWRVILEDGTAIGARDVVLATPSPVAAELLRGSTPGASSALNGLRYNRLAVVHLEAETDLTGVGFKVAFGEPHLALSGVTFNDSLFGRQNLYTAYVGGGMKPEVVESDDEEIARVVEHDFRVTSGFEGRAMSVRRAEIPAWDMSWAALRGWVPPQGIHVASNWSARPGIAGRLAQGRRVAEALSTPSPAKRTTVGARV